MTAKEKEILKNMKLLDISRKEAEELYISDHDEKITEEQKELTKKAKTLKRRYEKSDNPKKPAIRERKIDTDKQLLINKLTTSFPENVINVTIKNESEIHFSYNSNEYTIKLIKHRNK